MYSAFEFPGDEDERLKEIQHGNYSRILGLILRNCIRRYLYSEEVLQVKSPLSEQIKELADSGFDHRTVQAVHSLLAVWYRFSRRHELLFPLKGDPESDWLQFADREIKDLCSNPRFVVAILDAAIFANTERGYAGEREAQTILETKYHSVREHSLPHPFAQDRAKQP